MTFLNPFVLFALATAAIPLIIHLINLRKPRRVDFSSLVFLNELRQQTIRRLRIKQWLLLALRTLAIVFLVLAFARPTVESPTLSVLSQENRSVAVIVDNSLSMNRRDESGRLLTQALEVASGIANSLETADEIVIVPLASDGSGQQFVNPTVGQDQLDDLAASPARARFSDAFRTADAALESAKNPRREVYLISDIQRVNFSDTLASSPEFAQRMVVIPIGNGSTENVSITDVNIGSSIVEVDQPVDIDIEIRNHGSTAVRGWSVGVYLEDERVAQTTVSIEPGQASTASVRITPRNRGWLRGRVEIEDDPFEYDNQRFFTLYVPEERRVLVIQGEGRNADFLTLALSTPLRESTPVFNVEVVNEAAFSGTLSGSYDAVVTVGVRSVSPGMTAALSAFLQDGGGVFSFVGEEASAGSYQGFMEAVGGGSFGSILGGSTGSTIGTLDDLDREHPLFRGVFADENGDGHSIERPSFSKMVRYLPGPGNEQQLASTTLGVPMLEEIRFGPGKLILAPFLPEPDWTDLPVRGLFVPLLFRSMYYLTATEVSSGDGVVAASVEPLRVQTGGDIGRLRVVSGTGQEWIPDQRTSAQGIFFTLPATLREPGNYDVLGDETLLRRFSVNVDPLESNLESLPAQDAVLRLSALTGIDVSLLDLDVSDESFGETISAQETGVEIWNVFLLMALLFLVIEMLVAARWRPATATSATAKVG